jgi:predicted RNase H-like HicB family nuclease
MKLPVECEREADGRWLAEIVHIPGAMAYGATQDEAMAKAEAVALRAIADRIERGEAEL